VLRSSFGATVKAWVFVVGVFGAASMQGCSRDICSGLVEGDVLEIEVDSGDPSDGGQLHECDSTLGFGVGTRLRTVISENGADGCGTAIGPIDPVGAFLFEFDVDASREYGDSRSEHWVSVNSASKGECSGILSLALSSVEPEVISKAATGKLVVRYDPIGIDPDCPGSCSPRYSVTLSKPSGAP
jgi:hypothetical protein